jgi:PhnB protein
MKNLKIEPYLFFGGRCKEALKFYQKALGAKVDFMMLYKDSPEPMPPDRLPKGYENKVMHATFRIGQNILMGSDGCGEDDTFRGFSLSISAGTPAEAKKIFTALAKGGKVHVPLAKTFWSPCFGMVQDKFGMGWMVTVQA